MGGVVSLWPLSEHVSPGVTGTRMAARAQVCHGGRELSDAVSYAPRLHLVAEQRAPWATRYLVDG